MDYSDIIVLCIGSFGAGIVQRTTGFGFGIFLIPILILFCTQEHYAVTISQSTVLAMTIAGVTSYKNRDALDKSALMSVFYMMCWFVPTMILATLYLKHLDENGIICIVLGVSLILMSLWFMFKPNNLSIPNNMLSMGSLGSLSGVMGGMFSMQGPPAVIWFLASTDNKKSYIAQTQLFFCLGNLSMLIFRTVQGMLDVNVVVGFPFAIFFAYAGMKVGEILYDKLNTVLLKKIIYAYLTVSGIVMITR